MKLTFLGTGAADWPLERTAEMSEFRRMSALLIDDTLLIDPGPQVCDALQALGKTESAITGILNTHRHGDHFCEATLNALTEKGAKLITPVCGEPAKFGKYTIVACKGNHATCEETLHYIITDGARTVFYGLDGAWLLYDEVQAIKKYRPDFAILDGTIGYCDGDHRIFEHNNLNMVLEMQKTLNQYVGRFCITHMARTLHTDHQTLCKKMEPYRIVVAFDGLELEI